MKGDNNISRLNINEEQVKEVTNVNEDINDLINNYYDSNSAKSKLTKQIENLSNKIKEYLAINNLKVFEGNNHTAKVIESDSVSYDDIKLLELVKTLPKEYQDRLIDKIEIVNLTKLEREIIQGNIKVEQLKDAEIHKVVKKLYVK